MVSKKNYFSTNLPPTVHPHSFHVIVSPCNAKFYTYKENESQDVLITKPLA